MTDKLKTEDHFTIILEAPIRYEEGKVVMEAIQATLREFCPVGGTLVSRYNRFGFSPIKKEIEK